MGLYCIITKSKFLCFCLHDLSSAPFSLFLLSYFPFSSSAPGSLISWLMTCFFLHTVPSASKTFPFLSFLQIAKSSPSLFFSIDFLDLHSEIKFSMLPSIFSYFLLHSTDLQLIITFTRISLVCFLVLISSCRK